MRAEPPIPVAVHVAKAAVVAEVAQAGRWVEDAELRYGGDSVAQLGAEAEDRLEKDVDAGARGRAAPVK
jgi:hypothetical protein